MEMNISKIEDILTSLEEEVLNIDLPNDLKISANLIDEDFSLYVKKFKDKYIVNSTRSYLRMNSEKCDMNYNLVLDNNYNPKLVDVGVSVKGLNTSRLKTYIDEFMMNKPVTSFFNYNA